MQQDNRKSRYPACFERVTLRGLCPVDAEVGEFGLSFNHSSGEKTHFCLSFEDARWLFDHLAYQLTRTQSDKSEDTSKLLKSSPDDEKKQVPSAAVSAA